MRRLSVRPFAWGDIFIYLAVAVVIVVVCVVVFVPKPTAIARVEVYYQNTLVYAYDCTTGSGQAYIVDGVRVELDGNLVTVVSAKGSNTLCFAQDKVTMVQADCPGGDCISAFAPLTRGGEMLVCMPHELRVVALGDIGNEVVV